MPQNNRLPKLLQNLGTGDPQIPETLDFGVPLCVPSPLRHIAHFDLDAFFVSVELLKRPELRGKPLIVGGDGQRGIVAACSYEARKFGIQSAMPSLTAKKLCPEAIFISGSHGEYSKYSRLVTQIIADTVPNYEKAWCRSSST